MDINSFFQSKQFRLITGIIGLLILILLIFQIGVFVGMRKADFSYRWGENYHRMFGGPPQGFFQEFSNQDFIAGHGTVGTVIKIDGNLLIIKSPEGLEKTISLSGQTTIRQGREIIKTADIKLDNPVVIIGSPKDDGTIEARLIRIFDPTQKRLPPPSPNLINLPRF
ncbi:MAG: hypothetical protein WC768_03615 [Patescibacteria group bacterium]|jgi:hypothetical protein